MKLGKKLETTCIKERMKLLIDGEVFYTKQGHGINFDIFNYHFVICDNEWYGLDGDFITEDWYYPAKTYTINGVELVDERLSYADKNEYLKKNSYLSVAHEEDMFAVIDITHFRFEHMTFLLKSGLLHRTEEAAIAHTKAMIRVEGE